MNFKFLLKISQQVYVAAGFTLNPKLEETVTLSFSQQYSFTSVGYLLANAPSRAAHSCRNDASYTHKEAICWWTCTMCCTHAVGKLGPQLSKLHSWTEYYITIRIRQLPSQQALKKSYESQRMQPCQLSHCHMLPHLKRMCVILFLVIYLKHQCQVYWPEVLVLKSFLL